MHPLSIVNPPLIYRWSIVNITCSHIFSWTTNWKASILDVRLRCKQFVLSVVTISQHFVEYVCENFRSCFTWYLTINEEVFMWHLFDGVYIWDRVRRCVFESLIFENMNRNSVFNPEISRVPHFVTYLSVPLPPFKTCYMMCVSVRKRDTKRMMEGKTERRRESECVR